jgi:hypothetical protein
VLNTCIFKCPLNEKENYTSPFPEKKLEITHVLVTGKTGVKKF